MKSGVFLSWVLFSVFHYNDIIVAILNESESPMHIVSLYITLDDKYFDMVKRAPLFRNIDMQHKANTCT